MLSGRLIVFFTIERWAVSLLGASPYWGVEQLAYWGLLHTGALSS